MFRIEDSTFEDYFSNFLSKHLHNKNSLLDNSAFIGGAIKASSSNLILNKTVFRHNYANEAGVILADNRCMVNATSISATYNYAYDKAGVFNILTQSVLLLDSSYFRNNFAG